MSSNSALNSYYEEDVSDLSYKLISNDLEQLESHLNHFILFKEFRSYGLDESYLDLNQRFNEIHGIFDHLIGKNDNDYVSNEMYEDSFDLNYKMRNLLKGENNDMEKIIMKETFSPAKINTLNTLKEFFSNGDLEISQDNEKHEPITKDSLEMLRKELSLFPVSLAELINQERREGK
ncbi:hypothetical protein [Paenibacillus sp. USHLN196]|uniref:hypothetical protein n=1 Tax=Paenibacillus sp. USHLN196 TaxID=3081291 RepID=UPI003017A858